MLPSLLSWTMIFNISFHGELRIFLKCSYKEHGDIYRKNVMWIEDDIESGFKAYSKYKKCMKWNPVIKKYIFQELFPHMSRTERNCKILSIGSEGPWAISCWKISCWCVWRFVIVGNCESPFLNSSQSTVMWWGKSCRCTLLVSCASPKQVF